LLLRLKLRDPFFYRRRMVAPDGSINSADATHDRAYDAPVYVAPDGADNIAPDAPAYIAANVATNIPVDIAVYATDLQLPAVIFFECDEVGNLGEHAFCCVGHSFALLPVRRRVLVMF
jgi:hypothetical protein